MRQSLFALGLHPLLQTNLMLQQLVLKVQQSYLQSLYTLYCEYTLLLHTVIGTSIIRTSFTENFTDKSTVEHD